MASAELDRKKHQIAGVFLLALTLLNVHVVITLIPYLRSGYQDFSAFYRAAEMLRSGQAGQVHDLHPIFEELLFVPFTYVSFRAAYLLWTFLNLVMMALSLAIVRKVFPEVGELNWPLVILTVTGFTPAVRAIMQGQDSVLLLFVVMCGLLSLARGNYLWSGAALGAGLFKFHIVIPLALVLAIRRPRLLAGFSCVAVALVAISAMIIGWHGLVEYARLVLQMENHGAGGTPVAAMPNLRGLIAELAGNSNGVAAKVAAILGSICVLGIALWGVRRRGTSIRYAFAMAAVTCIMVSYHTVIHDLTLLLPVVIMLFAASGAATRFEMRADTALLSLVYTALFLGSSLWPWLNPWWWVAVVFWIWKTYGRSDEEAITA